MCKNYLSPSERLTAAHAALEEVTYELTVTCSDAHYLVAELQTALADAGISQATHPRIAECVRTLDRLLADHATAVDDDLPRAVEIAMRTRDRGDV
jgi:hypothetical protein